MESDKLDISVIMGIYNCEKTLGESIDSLLDQTYKNFELIMCDDGQKIRHMILQNSMRKNIQK